MVIWHWCKRTPSSKSKWVSLPRLLCSLCSPVSPLIQLSLPEGEKPDNIKEMNQPINLAPKFNLYRKRGITEMRPYVPGEDLTGISVNAEDTPEPGGMIARNSDNHKDQWYVAKAYFIKNYERYLND